jgi:hypothetical protein
MKNIKFEIITLSLIEGNNQTHNQVWWHVRDQIGNQISEEIKIKIQERLNHEKH